MFVELSETETEIMNVFWAKGEPMTFGELLDYFNTQTEKEWKKQTLNTFLFRLKGKKLLRTTKNGSYKLYEPTMSKEEYQLEESEFFLKKNYNGSVVKMFNALNGGELLDKKEIAELKNLLEEWEKE